MKPNQGFSNFGEYMSNKIEKLNEQNKNTKTKTNSEIFIHCSIFVNGVTIPPLQDIRKLVVDNGGVFDSYKTSTTTHEICNHYSVAQVKQILKSTNHFKNQNLKKDTTRHKRMVPLKRVTVDWLLACIEKGKLVPEAEYTPDRLNNSRYGANIQQFMPKSSDSDSHSTATISTASTSNSLLVPGIHMLQAGKSICPSASHNHKELSDSVGGENTCSVKAIDHGAVEPVVEFDSKSNPAKTAYKSVVDMKINNIPDKSIRSSCMTNGDMGDAASRVHNTDDEHGGELFLQSYFNHSRLHFLGTWKSKLPLLVGELQALREAKGLKWGSGSSNNSNVNKPKNGWPLGMGVRDSTAGITSAFTGDQHRNSCGNTKRIVIHIDMDCFFVSALIRDKPHLQELPVVVGYGTGKHVVKSSSGAATSSSDGGYSEISSCNYVARAIGIKNGMLMKHAQERCSQYNKLHVTQDSSFKPMELVVLGYDFELYDRIAREVYEIYYTFPHVVVIQPVSIDEVYLEFHETPELVADYEAYLQNMKLGAGSGGIDSSRDASAVNKGAIPSSIVSESTHSISKVPQFSLNYVYTPSLSAQAHKGPPVPINKTHSSAIPNVSLGLFLCQLLRTAIHKTTRCNVSAGVSYNMLLARLGTSLAKPNGQYEIHAGNKMERLRDCALRMLPNVGYVQTHALKEQGGFETCRDIWMHNSTTGRWNIYDSEAGKITKKLLKEICGDSVGSYVYNSAYGIDSRPLVPLAPRKSIGAEVNYGIRFQEMEQATVFISKFCKEVCRRMMEVCVKGSHVTLKVRKRAPGAPIEPKKYMGCGRCDQYTRSMGCKTAIYTSSQLATISLQLFQEIMNIYKIAPSDLRGFGLQVTKLQPHDYLSNGNSATTDRIGNGNADNGSKLDIHRDNESAVDIPWESEDNPVFNEEQDEETHIHHMGIDTDYLDHGVDTSYAVDPPDSMLDPGSPGSEPTRSDEYRDCQGIPMQHSPVGDIIYSSVNADGELENSVSEVIDEHNTAVQDIDVGQELGLGKKLIAESAPEWCMLDTSMTSDALGCDDFINSSELVADGVDFEDGDRAKTVVLDKDCSRSPNEQSTTSRAGIDSNHQVISLLTQHGDDSCMLQHKQENEDVITNTGIQGSMGHPTHKHDQGTIASGCVSPHNISIEFSSSQLQFIASLADTRSYIGNSGGDGCCSSIQEEVMAEFRSVNLARRLESRMEREKVERARADSPLADTVRESRSRSGIEKCAGGHVSESNRKRQLNIATGFKLQSLDSVVKSYVSLGDILDSMASEDPSLYKDPVIYQQHGFRDPGYGKNRDHVGYSSGTSGVNGTRNHAGRGNYRPRETKINQRVLVHAPPVHIPHVHRPPVPPPFQARVDSEPLNDLQRLLEEMRVSTPYVYHTLVCNPFQFLLDNYTVVSIPQYMSLLSCDILEVGLQLDGNAVNYTVGDTVFLGTESLSSWLTMLKGIGPIGDSETTLQISESLQQYLFHLYFVSQYNAKMDIDVEEVEIEDVTASDGVSDCSDSEMSTICSNHRQSSKLNCLSKNELIELNHLPSPQELFGLLLSFCSLLLHSGKLSLLKKFIRICSIIADSLAKFQEGENLNSSHSPTLPPINVYDWKHMVARVKECLNAACRVIYNADFEFN